MKYVIIIPDGCADEPQAALDGRTPLQAAQTPSMDAIARAGIVGSAHHVPAHLPAGSEVANMSLLGYDPNQYFTGRAPLEAAAQGIELRPQDWAIRCNLVTIQGQVMRDFTAGHVSTDEARQLLGTAQERCGDPAVEFLAGVSYRNLVIYRPQLNRAPFSRETRATPPHDLTDQSVLDDFPRGPGSDQLTQWMNDSEGWFAEHPVNAHRIAAGKRPATHLWLWGLGQQPTLASFESQHGLRGKMITAVDLLRGLARLIGWDCIEVPGATGYTDTDYAAKGRYAVAALPDCDLVCVHVEATDEASHEGNIAAKIAALEAIDQNIVGPLWDALRDQGDYRVLITPDHPTPVRTKTHSHGEVPWVLAGTGIQPGGMMTYDESVAAASPHSFPQGHELMRRFLHGSGTIQVGQAASTP